jgi:spermine oxidase
MFTPELPVQKTNAIKGLTLGTVDKIFLEFKQPFWAKDWQGFSLLWDKADWEEVRRMKDCDWLVDVFGFYVVDYQPNILCGWISGENARRMEMADEATVLKGVLFLLRKFLKNHAVPDPVRMER